jgi:hypothetical protein
MNKPPEIPKLIPAIPLPFKEVMEDVLKVKPPKKETRPQPQKRQDGRMPSNGN